MSIVHVLLALHILGGGVALLSGPVPMLARKGGALHRRWGRIFAAALALSSVLAFALALLDGSDTLLTIAVLTGFLVTTGVRALQLRRGGARYRADKAACLLLAGFAIWLFWRSAAPVATVGLFFGGFSLLLAVRQWRLLSSPRPDWLLAHITGMGGAYIATVTAFLVVNLRFLPPPVTFIAPTLIGTVILARAGARYATKP